MADVFLVGLMYLCSSNSAIALDPDDLHRLATARPIERLVPLRRKWTRLSVIQKEKIVTAYQAGETSTSLASRFSVSKSVVLSVLHKQGVQMRRQTISSTKARRACELYEAGQSLSQVAATLSLKQGSVRLALIEAGVQLRPATGASPKN